MMHKIEWNEDFRIGVQEIGDQHKKLIELLNDLIDADNLHVRSEMISKTLYALVNYSDVHFATEEKYMQQMNYPGSIDHKKEHSLFRRLAAQYCMDTVDRNKDVPHEIITFLAEWIVSHVLNSDQDLKKFLNELKQTVE